MLRSIFSKYRFLVVAIALFLIFDLGVLVLNFYTSGRVAEQTRLIDIAGRQRTLTQKMAKATLYIKAQKLQQWVYQSGLDELREHYSVFSNTMAAFNNGGEVPSLEGADTVVIGAVQDPNATAILREANQLWANFESVIDPMMVDTLITDEEIVPASEFIALNNLELFDLMDELTQHFARESARQTTFLRMAQVAGITLATINFFVILVHFLGQLRSRERKLELAKHESDQILDTINEGVFLVNHNLVLGGQHSKHLQSIFATERISGRQLERFLLNYFNRKTVTLTLDYVSLFFKPHVNADLIRDINPLKNVQATIPLANGEAAVKYLDFAFAKLDQGDEPPVVLVSVNDVTDTFLLNEKQRDDQEGVQQQLLLLSELLPVAYEDSQVFVQESLEGYEKLNQLLKNRADSGDTYHETIDKMFVETHKLKGNAAAMGFTYIGEQLHHFEDTLALLQKQSKIKGEDLLPLAIELRNLFSSLDAIEQVREQLKKFAAAERPQFKQVELGNPVPSENQRWYKLHDFVAVQASARNVQAKLVLQGFEQPVADWVGASLYPMAVQLIRNSLAHAIEPSELRRSLYKPIAGQISCTLSQDEQGNYRFVYMDDGRGFDFAQIRQKLVEQGRCTRAEAAQMSEQVLIKHAFSKRISTAQQTTSLAGRGVGLALVAELINSLNGRLKVRSVTNEFSRFIVDFPGEQALTARRA